MATYTSASLIDLFKDVLGGDLEFHLVYIHADYEIKPDGVAGEVRGTERLIELEKPLDSLSFVLALDAIRAFNQQRYEQVKENFLLLSRNTTGEKSILYQGLAFIAGGYEQWDKMDTDAAIKNLEEAEHYLEKVREFKGVSEVMKKIQANIYALRKVKESNEESIILNLYSNALRRIRERKFDDALARLYSTLERITQHQLEKYRIETSNPDYSNLPPEIVEKFKESLGFLPTELELKKNAILLILLGNPIGKEIEKIGYRKFLGLIGIRNSSILAHGIKPVSEANFTDFKEKLIEPVMKKFIEVNNISSDEIQKHSHIRGSEITEFLHKERIFPRV
jgi:CRISPR-associated protein (TIGR02710 family)